MGGSHNKKPELPALVSIPEHVLAQELDGECVLLNLETEDYHSLDPVRARVGVLDVVSRVLAPVPISRHIQVEIQMALRLSLDHEEPENVRADLLHQFI